MKFAIATAPVLFDRSCNGDFAAVQVSEDALRVGGNEFV